MLPTQDTTGKWQSQVVSLLKQVYISETRSARLEAARRFKETLEQKWRETVVPVGTSPKASSLHTNMAEELTTQLINLVSSPDVRERIAAVVCLDVLMDLKGESYREKIQRTHNGLRSVLQNVERCLPSALAVEKLFASQPFLFEAQEDDSELISLDSTVVSKHPVDEVELLRVTSKALGHLARTGGALAYRCVESEVSRAFERLSFRDHTDARFSLARLAAVFVLKEIAENAPAFFYGQRTYFVRLIWSALWDPKQQVRFYAALALRAFIQTVVRRDATEMATLIGKLLQVSIDNLIPVTKDENTEHSSTEVTKFLQASQEKPPADIKTERVHGSLLCLAELLRDEISRERLHGRFEELCEVVLYYQSSQDIFIRTAVVVCLPLLAFLDPTTFCSSPNEYLKRTHQVLISFHKLYLENEKLPAQHLVAYGQLAEAIGAEYILPFVNQVFAMIEDILPKKDSNVRTKSQRNAKDVFSCIRMLAETLESHTFNNTNRFHNLLDHMFAHGLSFDMVKALNSIGKKIPDLLPQIQERLLDSVSFILSRGSPFGDDPKTNRTRKYSRSKDPMESMNSSNNEDWSHSSVLIERALETVANFEFRGRFLSSFVRENIFDYMNSNFPSWRRLAVSACCRLLAASSVYALEQQSLFHQQKLRRVCSNNLVKEIAVLISRVLSSSVADRDERIRLAALEGLKDPRFSKYLSQPHLLNKVLICLYDESLSVKRVAISLCGNLSFLNPALVFPVLRRRLAQLLITLRCEGKTFALRSSRDSAAVLLSIMVRDAPRIVWPYVVPILTVLIVRLRETLFGSNNFSYVWDSGGEEAETVMYAAIGNVASNVGPNLEDLKKMLPELLSLLVAAVQDQTSDSKTKTAALNAFTLIVQNTSCVITPYNNFPHLLPCLLHAIRTETDPQVRQGVEQLLGTLGAIDPKECKYGVSYDDNETEHVLCIESSVHAPNYFMDRSYYRPALYEDYHSSYATVSPLEASGMIVGGEAANSPSKAGLNFTRAGNENKERIFSQRVINMALSNETLVSRLNHPYTANEEYFPSASLDALHRVLSDSKLSHHHREAVNAITCIVQSLGAKCNEILPWTLSKLLWTLRPVGIGIVSSGMKTSSSMGDLRRGIGSRSGGKYGSTDSLESLSAATCSAGSPPRGSMPWVTATTSAANNLNGSNSASSDPNLREYVFKALAEVVSVARQHVRPYSWDIISICRYYWEREPLSSELRTIVILVERTCYALMDEFAVHVPTLLPCIMATLHTDTSANRENALPVLHLLDVIGNHLEDYGFMLIPIVSKMACDSTASTTARIETLGILSRLITRVPIREVASQVIHSLLNALEQSDAKEVSLWITKILGYIAERHAAIFSLFVDTIVFVLHSMSGPIDPLLLEQLKKYRVDVSMFAEQGKAASSLRQSSLTRISSLSSLNRSGSSSSLSALEGSSASGAPCTATSGAPGASSSLRRHHVNQRSLKNAWNLGRRTTAEDWEEWLNKFSNGLFRESGSPSIRSCARLAEVYTPLMQELFNAAFLSCWTELAPNYQASLVETLLAALSSPSLPLDALQTLLSLAEFMEHDEKPLPIDVRRLAAMAYRCGAYAKALRYKEAEYAQVTQPQTAKSAVAGEHGLISIYNNLLQQESAVGALKDAEYRFGIRRREEWFEKLQRWDEALIAYEKGSSAIATNDEEKSPCEPERVLTFQKPVLSLQPQPSPDDAYEEPFAILSEWDRKLGMIRCLNELGEWRRMESLCRELWKDADLEQRSVLAYEGAASVAFNLDLWDEFEERVKYLQKNTFKWAFYNALMAVHEKEYEEALEYVKHGRRILDSRLKARAAEGYARAYLDIVNAERLVEIEEAIKYLKNPTVSYRNQLATLWKARLQGIQSSYFYWYRILRVRCVVFHPFDSMEEWIKFASLCRKSGRLPMSAESLRWLLTPSEALHSDDVDSWDIPAALENAHPQVAFALLKHVYVAGRKMKAFSYLKQLATRYSPGSKQEEQSQPQSSEEAEEEDHHLAARLYLKLAKWGRNLQDEMTPLATHHTTSRSGPSSWSVTEFFDSDESSSSNNSVGGLEEAETTSSGKQSIPSMISAESILSYAKKATELSPHWYKTWHVWASLNAELVSSSEDAQGKRKNKSMMELGRRGISSHLRFSSFREEPQQLVIQAIDGFFRTLALCSETAIRLQDILRLLTLWFRYGGVTQVNASINAGIAAAEVDLWLDVIPQLFARLHSPNQSVRSTVRSLLVRIGRAHPQALVYPLHVAAKSTNKVRREAAEEVLNALRLHSSTLVEQAETVSRELVRVAILWHEMWHEGLEEASRLYFGEHNVEGMLEVLEPLHAMLETGPETAREAAFMKEFGRDLAEAAEWCRRFKASGRESDMNQAWDLYYHVFRRINKQLPSMTTLDLAHVSPKLLRANNLELAIPGTYSPSFENNQVSIVRIAGFCPTVQVINSKQRPRRLIIYGSDGREHTFLLKGHEDLRQDERVMQLFGLVNELLSHNASTNSKALMIKRFSVVPLSPNTGLIGWVPGCDTLHSLIREFREQRKILLNVEHRLMLQMAPDYDNLTLIQKVEVFEYALSNTTGADLSRVLWLKSRNSEMWLDKRTTYTRSLATMSMVGYVLGLGDRHPSNLMLERNTGRIIHIDFGDCFEVAMLREKFPEKIPFRLTRMLVNAMEVCGIEGYFRHTCESVMSVLRDNKDSLMAMLEAFVHDPLINWRLLGTAEDIIVGRHVGENEEQQQQQQEAPLAPHDDGGGGGKANVAATTTSRPKTKTLAFSIHVDHPIHHNDAHFLSTSKHLLKGPQGLSLSDIARLQGGGENRRQDTNDTDTWNTNHNNSIIATSWRRSVSLRPGETPVEIRHRDMERCQGSEAIEHMNQAVNRRALAVIRRVHNKLTGRDFDASNHSNGNAVVAAWGGVASQVDRLIREAMKVENLCQCYIGWCAFW